MAAFISTPQRHIYEEIVVREKQKNGIVVGSVPFYPRIVQECGYQIELIAALVLYLDANIKQVSKDKDDLFGYLGVGALPFAFVPEDEVTKLKNHLRWGNYDFLKSIK